jgi:uncharacterized protein YlbG (UPF0298 family)
MLNRKSLIIYFKNPKAIKQIARVADIKYFNKKRKYAIIYVDIEEQEKVTNELKLIKLVRRVEESLFENDEYQLDFNVQ